MVYFYIILPVLATVAVVSICLQGIGERFVDLQRVRLHLVLVALLWASGGWLLEAQAFERAARVAMLCQIETVEQLHTLNELFWGIIE